MKLWMKVLIGLLLGVVCGLILGESALYLKPLGTLFLNLINMIIILLIFSSMVVGVNKIHDPSKLGRVGGRAIFIYFTTTLIAIGMGLFLANYLGLGEQLSLSAAQLEMVSPSIGEILIAIVPSNPIAAMANGNILQVIVFALFIGIAINFSGEQGRPLLAVLDSLADVMYRLTSLIMELSPLGVFGIMAWVTGTFGVALLLPLLKFLASVYCKSSWSTIIYCTLARVSLLCAFLKG